MKILSILAIVGVLLLASASGVLAKPWDNSNGIWIEDVECEGLVFDVFVPNGSGNASFTSEGDVGVTKSIYIHTGTGYEVVWAIPGNGVYKNTIWCTWELEGVHFGGDILAPTLNP